MGKHVRWPDLGRFGAALRVIPESPLRGVAMTCLEVRDAELFQRMFAQPGEDGRAQRGRFERVLGDLGFGVTSENITEQGEVVARRFVSVRTEFMLGELRGLLPGLEPGDLREMDAEAIALRARPEAALAASWERFAEQVLAKEAVRVWTPVPSPYARPFGDSAPVGAANPARIGPGHALLGASHVAVYHGLPARLERAHYRENALVAFYADQDSALADGWGASALECVDLPYALPLWVTPEGKIIAVRDVRFCAEIMDLDPEQYFNAGAGGLIVPMLREAVAVRAVVSAEVEQWAQWSSAPERMESSEQLVESIERAGTAVVAFQQRFPRVSVDLSRLQQQPGEKGGGFRLKAVADLSDADTFALARVMERFVRTAADVPGVHQQHLAVALHRARELIAARATDLARQQLREVAAQVQGGEASPRTRHVDSGEKIGGARKDFSRRALEVGDLADMNALERTAFVAKQNIWVPLDYKAMREAGVEPEAALAIKMVKDSLRARPDREASFDASDDRDADYVRAVAAVRDHLQEVRTLEEFQQATDALYKLGCTLRDGTQARRFISGGTSYQVQWGPDTARLIYLGSGGGLAPKIREAIEAKVWALGDASDDLRWSSLIKPKRSRSDAEAEAERKKTEQDEELHRPHLDRVERHGEDWRGGRDITADDLRTYFGFRGVEFGNWLPDGERQQVLNMAFDAFADLAYALDIPPSGVSLGGDLAVAFGSRGRGGRRAALAHFETTRNVINLTRLKGAGALAHEWMHALDFHLAEQKGFRSEQDEQQSATAMGRLARALKRRASTEDELYQRAQENAATGQRYTSSWLYRQPEEAKDRLNAVLTDGVVSAAQQLFEESVGTITGVKDNPMYATLGFDHRGAIATGTLSDIEQQLFESLREAAPDRKAFKAIDDKVMGNLRYMVRNLAVVCTVDAARSLGAGVPQAFLGGANGRDSEFHVNAKQLDQLRTSPYWATTREMFARAGAAYVLDKLERKETRSDYLVFGSDEARYATHPVGNPNPVGRDRAALESHFDTLIAEYRLQCAKAVDHGPEP